MVAVSTAHKLVADFGIDPANTFGFWDWVGGRFSVTSAVGVVPLALQYGFHHVENFLKVTVGGSHRHDAATERSCYVSRRNAGPVAPR